MWWTQGVASAIQFCQQQKSVLVILVEPTNAVMQKHQPGDETSQNLLSRLATTSMHTITFSQPALRETIKSANAVCLKFPSEQDNVDFKNFSAFFKLFGTPPNLYFISPLTGETLVHKTGFVSPKIFAEALISSTETVSDRKIPTPELEAPESSSLALQKLADQVRRDHAEEEAKRRNQLEKATQKDTPSAAQPARTPAKPVPVPPVPSSTTHPPLSQPTRSASRSMKLPSPSATGHPLESRLLVRFPDGSQVRKTFPASTKFSIIRYWLAEEVKKPGNAITIATAFPHRVFDLGDNPKMLFELGLVPTETLVVAIESGTSDIAPAEQSTVTPSVAGVRSYATSALQVLGGFFRSFVADGPNASTGENPRRDGDTRRSRAPPQMPTALGIERNGVRRSAAEDDENLLSNGNSTQYGWNPRDEEDE